MGVGDGAVGVGGAAGESVARGDAVLAHGVFNLSAILSVLGKAGPLVGPVVAVLGDGGIGNRRALGSAVEGERQAVGTDAVLVAVVGPGLGDGDVDRLGVGVGDDESVLGIAGDRGGVLARIDTGDAGLDDRVLDLLAISELGQILEGALPAVVRIERDGVGGGLTVSVERHVHGIARGALPDLLDGDVDDLGLVGVGDLAAIVDGRRLAGVTRGHVLLGYGVGDLFARAVKPRQALPDVGPGVAVLALGDLGRRNGGAGGRTVKGQLERLGTDAVLVAVVVPHLVNVDVDKLVLVGEGDEEDRVGRVDRTRGGLTALKGPLSVLIAVDEGERGTLENEALREFSLSDGIGRADRYVVDTDGVAGLHGNRDVGVVGGIPPAATIVRSTLNTLGDAVAVLVTDGNPDPVIGVVTGIVLLRRSCRGRKRIVDVQREREDGILRRVIAVDDLGDVEARAALVGCRESSRRFIDVVRGIVELVGGRAVRYRMIRVRLDEHRHHVVDEHRVHGRGVDLPLEAFALNLRLGEGEVVSLRAIQRLAVRTHDADGDEDRIRPAVVIVERHGVVRIIIARDVEGDAVRLFPIVLEQVAPVLGNSKFLDSAVLNRIGIGESRRLGTRIRETGVGVGERGSGVGLEVAVYVDILLDCRIEVFPGAILAGVVLDVRDIVERFLAGVDLKSHRVGDAVKQRADRGQVPVDRAVRELGSRRIVFVQIIRLGPLVLEVTGGDGAVDRDALRRAGLRPVNRARAVAVVGDRVGYLFNPGDTAFDNVHLTSELIVHNRDGEPVLVRALIDFEELRNTGAGCNLVGGTVADGNRGDTKRVDNFVEDLGDGSVESSGVSSAEEVRCVLGRSHNVVDVATTMLVVLGEVHEVVHEVALVAVGIDTVEGAASGLASLCNRIGIFGCSVIEVAELGDGSTRRVNRVVAVARCRRRTIGHHDDESRHACAAWGAGEQVVRLDERRLPVGAVGLVAAVAHIGLTVSSPIVEAVRKGGDIGRPSLPFVVLVGIPGERHESHVDVIFGIVLVLSKVSQEVVHDILGLIGTRVVATLSIAGHTRRGVVDDQDVYLASFLRFVIRVSGNGKLKRVRAILVVRDGLLVIGLVSFRRIGDRTQPEHEGERRA